VSGWLVWQTCNPNYKTNPKNQYQQSGGIFSGCVQKSRGEVKIKRCGSF
jgi:hypothetical protein